MTPIVNTPTAPLQKLRDVATDNRANQWYHDALIALWVAGCARGIDPAVLAAQCANETGWGKFQGEVKPEWGNTAGLRNYEGDSFARFPLQYDRFPVVGATAHADHLGAYAGVPVPPDSPNPRERFVRPGGPRFDRARHVEELGGLKGGAVIWASNPDYAEWIMRVYNQFMD